MINKKVLVMMMLAFSIYLLSSCKTEQIPEQISEQIPDQILDLSYFGEPGLTPEIFAPNFISTEADIEFAGSFTPDYQHYFFTKRIQGGTNRLFYTTYEDGAWTQPALSPVSEDLEEFEPFITPDGKTLFFSSKRGIQGEYATYQSDFLDGTWQIPVYLDNGINDTFAMYISVSSAGNMYFTGLDAIYVIEKINGEYQPLKSTGVHGSHPYIAPDESYMLFDRTVGNSTYLYITVKNGFNWGTPTIFGSDVNQEGATQICPSVTPDGKYFFFSRFIDGSSDIYWVDGAYLDSFKTTNVIFDYYDNTIPENEAIRFELPGGNQTWFWNGLPVFSPDGNQIYWSRFISNQDLAEIWYVEKVDGFWSQARKLVIEGIDGGTASPRFLDDPNQMYFMNLSLDGAQNIYQITRIDGIWSNPIALDINIPEGYEYNWNFSLADNKNVYFSLRYNFWSRIYYSVYDQGTYGPPIAIDIINGDNVNTSSPFVAPDESYILFASHRPESLGHHDIFLTVKRIDGTFSALINLGGLTNLYEEELDVSISEDGQYLFFTARRGNDVFYSPYWRKFDEIQTFIESKKQLYQ
jgi:Tol biopolymer transport system component